MSHLWVFLVAVVISSSCKFRDSSSNTLSTIQTKEKKWPGEGFYNFDNLSEKMKLKGDIPDVETFLKLLPQTMLRHFTLMRETETDQQSASPDQPRTILFHPEGGLYIAFSGAQARSVELISVPLSGDKFQFFKLDFPLSYQRVKIHDNSQYLDDCKACHETDPRPNWGNYDFWRGAYGSDDDFYDWNTKYDSKEEIARRKKELQELKDFLRTRPQMKNYRLLEPAEGSSISPYRSESTAFDFHLRPNAHLTMLFANINARRISRLIGSSKLFSWSKYLILFSDDYCRKANFPENLKHFLQDKNSGILRIVGLLTLGDLYGDAWWKMYLKLHGIVAKDYQLEFSEDSDEFYFDGTSNDGALVPAAVTEALLQDVPSYRDITRLYLRIDDYNANSGAEDSPSKYDKFVMEKLDRILPLRLLDFNSKSQIEQRKICESAGASLLNNLLVGNSRK